MNKKLEDVLKIKIRKIKSRCINKQDPSYSKYGAKGIKVCDEWLINESLFINWALVNGFDCTDKKIYRKDLKGDYSPENCLIMNDGEYFSYMADLKDQKKEFSIKKNDIIKIRHNGNLFTIYLIDGIPYLSRKDITEKVFGYCNGSNKSKVLYYQKKALNKYPQLDIKSYSYNGTNRIVYSLNALLVLKSFFIFSNETEVQKYDELISFFTKCNSYLNKINVSEGEKDIKEQMSTKDLKFYYTDKLMSICNKQQKVVLNALISLFDLEEKQQEKKTFKQTYAQIRW